MNWLVLTICICTINTSNSAVKANLEKHTTEPITTQKISSLQEQIQYHIKAGTITSTQSVFLSQAMWSHIQFSAFENQVKIIEDPNSHKVREQIAQRVLGMELYSELESILLEAVKSSPNQRKIEVSVRMLGKGLSSSRARSVIKEKLDNESLKLLDTNKDNDPDPNLLYYLAEALCYMGDESGLDFIRQALESEGMSTGRRCAAIRALAALSTAKAKTILLRNLDKLLLSENATVARCALKNLQVFDEFGAKVHKGVYKQLSRFATNDNVPSGQEEQRLLINITSLLNEDIRQNKLSNDEKSTIKKSVKSILHNRPTELGDRVATLFAMLADDEDKDTIAMMLNSESSRYRSQGTRSILVGSHELKEHFLPDMIKMLDDPDSKARDYALTIVRRYKGEQAGTGIPEEVFEKEREKIKQWWKEQKK